MKRSFGARPVAYPLPVFVIGTYDNGGKADAMVAAWGGICASEPPCIAVTINPAHQTFANISNSKAFTVSIPSVRYIEETDYCGMVSGRDQDKFLTTGLTAVRAEFVGAPFIDEFPVVLECRLSGIHEIGSARQIIGEILDVKIDESVLDADGKPDLQKIGTFAFDVMRMEYYSLGPVVGKAWNSGRKFIP
ncbi:MULTISPECIES: flavin reductase family protein [unclassified Methanoregula]|uniref:flavin reductase family protein n=1 Tax=unclassified Methanoregula TaxID=2649730 RepID=UPI0009D439C4|nr:MULTISPECIES: flavin reductase family protein [unclassified Methanoregula]OPX64374.1 MAG: Flavin reductase like domain protein [Methanoregula sp. PtaB.Bin085]OPY34956.1 MAG: Flavin reductase like domain protein [Methanoregula sp. PtaU1.Bin006]